jgi:hypothetical protein
MYILNWRLFLEELVGYKPISDIQSYIDGMNTSIKDKLFFTDMVDFDVIVDFGCADGILLENILKLNSNIKVIGYDLDEMMLSRAKNRLGSKALLTNDWSEAISAIKQYKMPLLNLSSVIHEVYSYSHGSIVKKFWEKQVFGGNFKWITIRDMIPSLKLAREEISVFEDDVRKVRLKADKKYFNSFEKRWGTISDNYKTFIHYLLKYRYTDNWDREVNEDYLPVSLERVKSKIPSNYEIVYEKSFLLDFLKQQVKKDFDVELTHSTHTKLIIENKSLNTIKLN